MELEKFCNISKKTMLGIPAGGYVVVTKKKADFLANQVKSQMGTNFIILPLGRKIVEKLPIEKLPIEKHIVHEPEVKKIGRRSDKTGG